MNQDKLQGFCNNEHPTDMECSYKQCSYSALICKEQPNQTNKHQIFKFSQALLDNHTCQVQNNGNTIKRIKQDNGHLRFALVYPSLSQTAKVRFKIIKQERDICFGIYDENALIQSRFQWTQNRQQFYCIESDDCNYHGSDYKYCTKSYNCAYHGSECKYFTDICNFSMNQGDEIQMEWLKESSQLRMTNHTNRNTYTFQKVYKNSSFCFGVCLYNEGDQVKIIS